MVTPECIAQECGAQKKSSAGDAALGGVREM
jgi:hypothetical protein